jgi:hypothetical protein
LTHPWYRRKPNRPHPVPKTDRVPSEGVRMRSLAYSNQQSESANTWLCPLLFVLLAVSWLYDYDIYRWLK